MAVGGAKLVVPSLVALEAFPDTYNPGYFFIKQSQDYSRSFTVDPEADKK